MTGKEAYQEAKRRWGPDGMCWLVTNTTGSYHCMVGVVDGNSSNFHIHGQGATLEEAFADADRPHQWVHEGMNGDEALREAYNRWGFRGVCRDRGDGHHPLVGHYMVGVENQESGSIIVHGEGPTWEAAFEEASGRAEFMAEMTRCPCGCGAQNVSQCWKGSIDARCCICGAHPCYQMIGDDPWCVRCAER